MNLDLVSAEQTPTLRHTVQQPQTDHRHFNTPPLSVHLLQVCITVQPGYL